jgi:hypothetical protein
MPSIAAARSKLPRRWMADRAASRGSVNISRA